MFEGVPVSCLSATMVLAYCQHYTCKYIPGRSLTNTDLRALSAWLGCSTDKPARSLRQHPTLALHVSLLKAAGLLTYNENIWYLTPRAIPWLNFPHLQQSHSLMAAIEECRLRAALQELSLTDTVAENTIAFTLQQLQRYADSPDPQSSSGRWINIFPNEWQLCLTPTLSSKTLFHLLQLGTLVSGSILDTLTLSITPLTIAQADRRGYSLSHMIYIMEEATGQPLAPGQHQQLLEWVRRADAYTLNPVTLLTVKQPQQLANVIGNGNLRQHVHTQLSPRHATVSPNIFPALKKWAARHHYALDSSYDSPAINPSSAGDERPTEFHYLGLRLLMDLGKLIPLPYAPPAAELEHAAAHLSPEQQTQLNTLANTLLTNIQEAISGRDAFFSARQAPSFSFIEQIERAIRKQTTLTLRYNALNAPESKQHTIEPHRLEKRGQLYYLHAYSYRAEANLTFRLDRIVTLEVQH